MPALLTVGGALLPLAYLALLIDYGATFFLRTRTHGRTPHLIVVVAVHLGYLVLWGLEMGHAPVTGTAEILSVLALATAAVYAWIEAAGGDRRTGVFVLLLAFLFQYAGSFLTAGSAGGPPAEPPAGGVWAGLHVLPALVAYTALGFAGVYGALYLAARRDLRRHRFGMFFDRLPPLETLGPMAWHALLTGFVAMTIAIAVTPFMFGDGGSEMSAKIVSKIVTGSVAWVVCAAAVLGRWLGRWHHVRTSTVAVVGFLLVMALLAVSGALS
ncbi:MAG: cytochrome c biogenesis protein CcsA [Phycisphaerae bacterium]